MDTRDFCRNTAAPLPAADSRSSSPSLLQDFGSLASNISDDESTIPYLDTASPIPAADSRSSSPALLQDFGSLASNISDDESSISYLDTAAPIPPADSRSSSPSLLQDYVSLASNSVENNSLQLTSSGTSQDLTGIEASASMPSSCYTQPNSLDTTVSTTIEKTIRRRKANKWISTFQIMEPPGGTIQGESRDSCFVTDAKSVKSIDCMLKRFFELYNKHAKVMRQNNIGVCYVLGGRYVSHPKINLIAGILVMETAQMCETPRFDCHLLIEKTRPTITPSYGECHKIYIGHAYPIHTTDVSCIGGNALRPLLAKWVEPEKSFFQSLHWIIPPSSEIMHKLNPKEAELRDEEAYMDFIELISEMKNVLLRSHRRSLNQMKSELNASSPNSQQKTETNKTMFEFVHITKGSEHPVEAHHWYTMQIPLDSNGQINKRAYRAVTAIKKKGGV
ncbi:hypothetical protein SK128_024901, partial [Halocaridina rubra]